MAKASKSKAGAPKKKAGSEITALGEGKILDYITGKPLKDSPKEIVRQRIARALFHEYGISVDDMEPDFKLTVEGRNKNCLLYTSPSPRD